MSIKSQIKVFKIWQQNVIGYDRYRIRHHNNDISVDVYTNSGKYITLKKFVTSEEALVEVFAGIIDLYEGAEAADLYRKRFVGKTPGSKRICSLG